MQTTPHADLDVGDLNVTTVFVPGDGLPLAAARNAAASVSSAAGLVFLDVDCVPCPEVVENYDAALRARDAVFMGEVFYLPRGVELLSTTAAAIRAAGVRHPARPDLSGPTPSPPTHTDLWSLSFGIRAETWRLLGGMDGGYEGYGAEDTDFGMRLGAANVEIAWLPETICAHQHHAVHTPPLHHFDSIVRNAQRFRERWGRWCMEYWLDLFAQRGYVVREDETVHVLRRPSEAEVAATLVESDVPFG